MYALLLPATAVLGTVVAYSSRLFGRPADPVPRHEMGSFTFDNGILLPHREYLYGSSGVGAPFIVGKKLSWQDYSRWESEYLDFPRLQSVTFVGSGWEPTWSSSAEAPKASANSSLLKTLLWLVFGAMCAIFFCYVLRKIVTGLSSKKRATDEEVMALPTGETEAKYAKLNRLWRCSLISSYREMKREVTSLKQRLHLGSEHARELETSNRTLERETTDLKETV